MAACDLLPTRMYSKSDPTSSLHILSGVPIIFSKQYHGHSSESIGKMVVKLCRLFGRQDTASRIEARLDGT